MSIVDRVVTDAGGYFAVEFTVTDHETLRAIGTTTPADLPASANDTSCRIVEIIDGGAVLGYESNYTQALHPSFVAGGTYRNVALTYDNAVMALAYCFADAWTQAETLLAALTDLGAPIFTAANALTGQVTSQIGSYVTDLSASTRAPLVFDFWRAARTHADPIAFDFGTDTLIDYDGSTIDYRATAATAYALGFYSHWNDGLETECATFADALIAYDIPTDIETAVMFYYALQWAFVALRDTKYRSAAIQVRNSIYGMTPSGMRETALFALFLQSTGGDSRSYVASLTGFSGDQAATFLSAAAVIKSGRADDYATLLARYPRLSTRHYSNNVIDTAWHVFAAVHEKSFELLFSQQGFSATDEAMGLTRNKARPMRESSGGSPMGLTREKVISLGFSRP